MFYSHSYSFNFGIPYNHTGAMAAVHVNKNLDLMGGVVRGVNTSIEDNTASVAFHGGAMLNLNDGKFLVSLSTHIGLETPHNNRDWRYLNSLVATWKINDKLTSITA